MKCVSSSEIKINFAELFVVNLRCTIISSAVNEECLGFGASVTWLSFKNRAPIAGS